MQIPAFEVNRPKEVFDSVETARMRLNQRKVLEVVVCTTLWVIWRYRNDVLYEVGKMKKCVLIDSIKEFSFVWFCKQSPWFLYSNLALRLQSQFNTKSQQKEAHKKVTVIIKLKEYKVVNGC